MSKNTQSIGVGTIIIGLLFFCCLYNVIRPAKSEPATTTTSTTVETIAPPTATQNLPLAQQTEANIKALVKDATDIALSGVEIAQENGYIKACYYSESLLDENDGVFDACEKSAKIMPVIFGIAGVQSVDIILETSFTDVYGKKNTDAAVLIGLTKAEADKVNWSEINSSNRAGVINVATSLYVHPAVKKNIDNEDILDAIIYYGLKQ